MATKIIGFNLTFPNSYNYDRTNCSNNNNNSYRNDKIVKEIAFISKNLYPYEISVDLIVSLNDKGMSNVRYSLHSMNGNVLGNGKIRSDIQQIDISGISEGMYILNVFDRNGNKLAVEKIIKK